MIYLDHAATTPVPRAVADEMYRVLTEEYGNPSSQYPLGRQAAAGVAGSRQVIAQAMGCAPEQLRFTSCGTESDNWAISAALYQNRHVGRHIITTAVEHSAVLEPCQRLAQEGYELTVLSPDRRGNITAEQVAQALRPDTALISMMLVNNELGTVYPVAEVAGLLQGAQSRALLHTDAVQGFLKTEFPLAESGADLISISAHKIGGPKGIGALYLGRRVRNPRPLLPGGGQEGGLRSGTEATAQIAGFAKAVELWYTDLPSRLSHLDRLRRHARERLTAIPGVQVVGDGTAPHVLCVSLEGYPSQNVVEDLGAQGICLSAGSACHKGRPSHVISALKLPKKVAAGVLRFSFGPETTFEEIDDAAAALRRHRETRFPML
ncbi:cysteine desulfurase [Oscillibacter sp. MSJ-2]|uniref:Cysteine desulfurase n=1 Tax=Dysosmobacter acutus TaxID=2841504 RepID=A0ABS6FDI7_9FIRM|nr:cysteine desulfurase family protein [Dysosmobacter acutus]MBU5628123.1 cysteine desulfurase [Dysosmobacter acutus]